MHSWRVSYWVSSEACRPQAFMGAINSICAVSHCLIKDTALTGRV